MIDRSRMKMMMSSPQSDTRIQRRTSSANDINDKRTLGMITAMVVWFFLCVVTRQVASFTVLPTIKVPPPLPSQKISSIPSSRNIVQPLCRMSTRAFLSATEEDDDDEEGELDALPPPPMMDADDDDDEMLSDAFLQELTMPQLKQQLRLRGLKVTGKKQELIDRLLKNHHNQTDKSMSTGQRVAGPEAGVSSSASSQKASSTADETVTPEFIDVTAYLDEDEVGQSVKSSIPPSKDDDGDNENAPLSNPEVWGSDAKIVDDYEGRNPVVDGLSRTVIEYSGSNQTRVQAFVVASRDAMKPFLQGGMNRTGIGGLNSDDPEATLREIQTKRELAQQRTIKFDIEAEEGGDDEGYYENAMNRDYSDWGKYTVTGAQLSAQEVQGVLILSDVYGAFTAATRTLAEKIAFECQPVVCMVPDLFRRNPWKEDASTPGFNDQGQDYEEWRATHPDLRVSIDIRAAAAVLREQYGVSSVVVWGTCYGGGRALEAAAGYFPNGVVHDVTGAIGPPPIDPDVVVAWYPTRYNGKELFGPEKSQMLFTLEKERNFAVMGVFAGKDKLPGATSDDAGELKKLLGVDDRVKDYMIKVFPGQDHGFAHSALGRNQEDSDLDRFVDDEFGGAGRVSIHDGDAEVACLLSTAFMETYSRKFLPTAGDPISRDKDATDWNEDLNMKDFSDQKFRDVRQEIEDSLTNYKEIPLGGQMIDPTNEEEVMKALRAMEPEDQPDELRILDGDDIQTALAKLKAADENFQLF